MKNIRLTLLESIMLLLFGVNLGAMCATNFIYQHYVNPVLPTILIVWAILSGVWLILHITYYKVASND